LSADELSIATGDGVLLSGEQSAGEGDAAPIVLLHGLTATRRYVVMGSRRLERAGYRVIAYDARGHGRSAPAPDSGGYGYQRLAADLLDVLDTLELPRALLVGASMGAHTALRVALERPERVAGLVLITPSFDPAVEPGEASFAGWDALSDGLREHGIEGFLDAYDFAALPEQWRATVATVIRQRLGAHQQLDAVADALRTVPRSRPFQALAELRSIAAPTVIVGSRDGADPGHPLAVAESYAQAIPASRLYVEQAEPTARSPIAWQGGQLSRIVEDLAVQLKIN
jgi:pimeloyl-ACP methyl ester carboxylesterase